MACAETIHLAYTNFCTIAVKNKDLHTAYILRGVSKFGKQNFVLSSKLR